MAKFLGCIGLSEPTEVSPGIYEEEIREMVVTGEIIRDALDIRHETNIVPDISLGNAVRILLPGPRENVGVIVPALRYIRWMGVHWTIKQVEVQYPRLLLRLGGEYNGPIAKDPITSYS